MKLFLFVKHCNNFFQKDPKRVSEVILSRFVIKSIITKILDSIRIHCLLLPKLSREEGTIANANVIVT